MTAPPVPAAALRDYFAAAALAGLLVGVQDPNEDEVAAMAYRVADAMLDRSEQIQPPPTEPAR